jgi:sugar (pentulose or hexulose) kinase
VTEKRKNRDGANAIVFDAGRTHVKVSVVTPAGRVLAERRMATPTCQTALYTAIDTDMVFDWLLLQLKGLSSFGIDRIIPVAHGAACAFLDENLALIQPVQDYESAIPPVFAAAYACARPVFGETLSPPLPKGLNLGAQIFWHARRDPQMFRRVRWILPYPQYWAWRLSGALTSELTSLGCHSDLWSPARGDFSSLAHNEDWARRFPPLVKAWETAGGLQPHLARLTGLPADTQVCAGLHDSGAALASLLGGWRSDTTLPALLSTGTWFIAMAPGAPLQNLQAERDCMGAIDVFGHAVPCARFMGGRAFELITCGQADPDIRPETLVEVMRQSALALPSFLDAGGPYPGLRGEIRGLTHDTPTARTALGTLYQALLSVTCLGMIQSGRTLVVEGAAANNPVLCGLIAALHDGPVLCNPESSGVTQGAAALAFLGERPMPRLTHSLVAPLLADEMRAYRQLWMAAIDESVAA